MADLNETLVRDLATGGFIRYQRKVMPIGGTGTGKTYTAIDIAGACICRSSRDRFFNVVDVAGRLEVETRVGREGHMAHHLFRCDFVIIDCASLDL